MKRTLFALAAAALILGGLLWTASASPAEALPKVTVFKSPTCNCCYKWIGHLEEAGFEVDAREVADLAPIKDKLGVPGKLASCHTAVVDGYVVEGHVPADDVKRLLQERPEVKGIAVPGMPTGSPGMEVPGRAAQPYDVIAFGDDAEYVFAEHR